jgi:hypothetical protein
MELLSLAADGCVGNAAIEGLFFEILKIELFGSSDGP